MKNLRRIRPGRFLRLGSLLLTAALLVAVTPFWGGTRVEANHPVLVEGNCDSPVPGTTIVAPGTCGDYDGDGRIGTAEDTDGADRIFGTLNAALGPGTGAAAGTGANMNGRIVIVASGRFSEAVNPMTNAMIDINGSGNVTIEAAPGVEANIGAVLQGDPAGGNNIRQEAIGINISYGVAGQDGAVTLRNLKIRDFAIGVRVNVTSRVNIDNCVFESNRDIGLQTLNTSRVAVGNSQFNANGRRIGTANNTTAFGYAIMAADSSQVRIRNTTISHSLGAGIARINAADVAVYRVKTYFNNPDILGGVVIATDPNFSQ